MCRVGLPDATAPLWQLAQGAATPRWSKRAGIQAVVVWQFSQVLLVVMCAGPLPAARAPLWQLKQLLTTPAWVSSGARVVCASPVPATIGPTAAPNCSSRAA